MSKSVFWNISDFFDVNNNGPGKHFSPKTFSITSIFKTLYFLQVCPFFVCTSFKSIFTTQNNFLSVCWFLAKNLTNFGTPLRKFPNRTYSRKYVKSAWLLQGIQSNHYHNFEKYFQEKVWEWLWLGQPAIEAKNNEND